MTSIQSKKLFLGIVGGGPKSWIGHVHRIASRFDDRYEIVAGVFSRNPKLSKMFGKSLGISSDRCYSNFCHNEKELKLYKEACNEVFYNISKHILEGNLKEKLDGPVKQMGFKRLT